MLIVSAWAAEVAELSERIFLVAGPPDMIATRSGGLAAIAVPGGHAWQSDLAPLLARRQLQIVMDADKQGRATAERIVNDLRDHPHARVVDLTPRRADGYDLTDWLLDNPFLTGWPAERVAGDRS